MEFIRSLFNYTQQNEVVVYDEVFFKDYPSDKILRYIKFIDFLLENGNSIEEITKLEAFRKFRIDNLICFGEAYYVDQHYGFYGGSLWLSAFDYPSENDVIYRNGISCGRATNVGFLTFDSV